MPDSNRSDAPANRGASVRRMFYFVLLTAGLGFAISSVVLLPLFTRFANDVAYQDAWWVFVLYCLTKEGLWNLAVFTLTYAATLYAVWCGGFKKALGVILLYTGLTMCVPALNFLVDSISSGAIGNLEEYFTIDLPTIILPQLLLEIGQYALIVLIAVIVRFRYEEQVLTAEGMKLLPRSKRVDYPMPPPPFPFVRLVSFKNPLQLGALLSAATVFFLRVGSYLINEITEFLNNGASNGWLSMSVDFASHIILAVLMYFGMLLLILRFHRRDGEKG